MSKKKKKKEKELETDYVILLMIDDTKENSGIIKMVHRSEINEYYADNWSNIEVILIPMDDGLQYAILRDLPKPFKEFNINFDLYVTSYYGGDTANDYYEPLYYKIRTFDVRCNDIVDYVRFIFSFELLTTLFDELSICDDYLSSVSFVVEKASYEYIKPNGEVIKDRVRNKDEVVVSTFDSPDFIIALSKILCRGKFKKAMSHFGFSVGLDDTDAIIIDLSLLTWTILPEFGAYGHDYLDTLYLGNNLLGVYSDITNTCVFESPDKIMMFSGYDYFTVTIATFMCVDSDIEVLSSEHKSLFNHLIDTHGFDYAKSIVSMKELLHGSLSDHVENFTIGHLTPCHDYCDIMLLMVNALTITRISDIVHSWIGVGVFTMIQFDHEVCGEGGNIHCFLCEDVDMMSIYKDSFYDRFMNKLTVLQGYDLDDEEYEYSRILDGHDRVREDPNDLPF